MLDNYAQFLTQVRRNLFSAAAAFLMLSIFLQTLVIGQLRLITIDTSPNNSGAEKTKVLDFTGPLVSPSAKIFGNDQTLLADCSTQAALRQEISNRWRFFVQPIPSFQPGLAIPGFGRKARKNYEELYWSARALEEVGKQLLREARKEVDKNLLSPACAILNQVLHIQNEITAIDADAINIWNGSLTNTYNRVKKIRDLCIDILQVGSVFVSAGIPLLVLSILNSLLKEMTDNALFQANLPPETYARIIIQILIEVLLEIKVPRWGNKTFSDYIAKKITIPTIAKNPPGFVKLIKEAFKAYYGQLKPALERKINTYLGGVITRANISILVEGLSNKLEQFVNANTNSRLQSVMSEDAAGNTNVSSALTILETTPAEISTEVNSAVPTITIRFGETLQAVNVQAQLVGYNGSVILPTYGVIGETLFFNLGSSLQPNTSYTMRLQAGSVRGTESNVVNSDFEWSFVTDDIGLTNGSQALVTNTGGVGLRLRNNPSTNAAITATLPESTRVAITGNPAQSNGFTWYPVQIQGGQAGWLATGNWLSTVDNYGFRPGGEVRVSNTSGVGLRLRVDAGEGSPIITVLSEGTVVKLMGEPVFADGYSWFPVQTSDGTQGYSAVARWLIPYSQAAANQLVIRTMTASTTAKLDWGQNVTFEFNVTDGNGLPVSGVTIGGQNNLVNNIFIAPSVTDVNGRTSYTTTVPNDKNNGLYAIIASASRNGFANSLSVTRNTNVWHGCSYQVHATDNTFDSNGGSGSLSVITQPGCGWSVAQYPSFVNLTSSDNGIGDGQVIFNVSANTSPASRSGNMMVAGSAFTITQDGGQANASVSIGTDPDGLSFTVDGQTYTSRQSFLWANGSSHTVSTTSPQTIGSTHFNFVNWSDGGSQTHTITAFPNQNLTAGFELPNSANSALDYSWQTRSISIAHGDRATGVTPGDGFLYVLGGSLHNQFSRFNPSSNEWIVLPNIPGGGMFYGAAAALSGKIYVLGRFTSDMQVYDIASEQWTSNLTGPYTTAIGGASFIVVGGELYVVGGADNNLNPVPGLKKYNFANNSWIQLADMPTPRGFAATTLVEGRIYVAGGNVSGYGTTSVNIYDPQNNSWSVGTPLPQTRILAAAVAVNSRLLVIGGSNGAVETRTVLEYNPVSDVWRELSQFNQGRYGAIGAFLRGKIYLVGGGDMSNPNTPIANLEEGSPSSWAPTINFHQQIAGGSSGNRIGVVELSLSAPQNQSIPINLSSSDPSKINFPFTYSFSPGQTSIQIAYRTGYAGGPVTIIAELPDNLARMRAYKQIIVPAGIPEADTLNATDVTSNTASLNGMVNTAGSSTTAYFEWGTDANLNSPQTTTQVNAGDGLTPVTVISPLSGLLDNTTYYYRITAVNAVGTARSNTIRSFTTARPTAANVSVTGRVVSASGRGIAGVPVTFTNLQGEVFTARTNQLGRYVLNEMRSGETYVVAVTSKRYRFETQILNLNEESADVNFTAAP